MLIGNWSLEKRQVLVINDRGHQHINGIWATGVKVIASRVSADPQDETHEDWAPCHTDILRWQWGGGESSKEHLGDNTEVAGKPEGWCPGILAKKVVPVYQVHWGVKQEYRKFQRTDKYNSLTGVWSKKRGKLSGNTGTLATVSCQISKTSAGIVFHIVP